MNSKLRDTIWQLIKNTRREAAERQGDDIERLTFETDKAEKAIRQAVGEEMLELVGGKREWDTTEPYDNPDIAQGYNEAVEELRQKIKEWAALKETTKEAPQ